MQAARSPDEVAGVIGHELGHVRHHDVTEALIRQLGLSVLLGGLEGHVGGYTNALLATAYSRRAEENADRFAMAQLREAAVSPAATAAFFRRLGKGAEGAERMMAYVNTHPVSADRARQFEASADRISAHCTARRCDICGRNGRRLRTLYLQGERQEEEGEGSASRPPLTPARWREPVPLPRSGRGWYSATMTDAPRPPPTRLSPHARRVADGDVPPRLRLRHERRQGAGAGGVGEGARAGVLRFDYAGCGDSEGAFEEQTLADWLGDALALIDELIEGPVVLVGSSMGGWLMLLAARARPARVVGLVGVAPAPDFTDWGFTTEEKLHLLSARPAGARQPPMAPRRPSIPRRSGRRARPTG